MARTKQTRVHASRNPPCSRRLYSRYPYMFAVRHDVYYAFGTAGSAAALRRLASGTAILNYRNPHSAYNDKGGKEYSQYVTEFLHKRCKDRKF